MAGEKAKNFKGSSKRLLKYLRPFWVPVIFVMLFAAASTVFSIVGPKVLALATDELANGLVRIVTGAQGGIDFGYIGKVLLLLGGIYLLSAGFSYAQGFIMAGVTADLSYGLRGRHREENQQAAPFLLPPGEPGRRALPHHQRRGHADKLLKPKRHPDDYLGVHPHRRADYDAHHQLAAHLGGPVHCAGVAGVCHGDCQVLPKAL